MSKPTKMISLSIQTLRLLYLITLFLYFIATFLPELRLWGINPWGELSLYARFGWLATGVIFLALEFWLSRSGKLENLAESEQSPRQFTITLTIAALLLGTAAFLLRPETFFLGDGYQLISIVASDNPFVKIRDVGSLALPYGIAGLLGSSSETSALTAFRIVSWLAGAAYLVFIIWLSAKLFESRLARLQFSLLLLSTGSMLLFFGYVETYAMPTLCIMAFGLVGLCVVEEKLARFWVMLPFVAGLFFHPLIIALLPALVYLLVRGTKIGNWYAKTSAATKWLLVLVIIAGGAVPFVLLYQSDFNFRATFIPIIASLTTVDSYTLFSWKHLADYLNLFFILMPPTLVYGLIIWRRLRMRSPFSRSEWLLGLMALGSVALFFVLDPRLGMARDWDLFSLIGGSIALLVAWILVRGVEPRVRLSITILAFGLGCVSLVPRAYVLSQPELGIAQAERYFALDIGRSRAGLTTLADYYLKRGDSASEQRIQRIAESRYPSVPMIYTARNLSEQGRSAEAKRTLIEALRLNATFADAWLMLSQCYVSERNLDSALICARISDGLNPYNPATLEQMAFCYFMMQKYNEAEKIWLAQIKSDSSWANPLYGLACIAKRRGEISKYEEYLTKAGSRKDAPPQFLMELADHYLASGRIQAAASALKRAAQRGLNRAMIDERVARYPQLKEWLGQ